MADAGDLSAAEMRRLDTLQRDPLDLATERKILSVLAETGVEDSDRHRRQHAQRMRISRLRSRMCIRNRQGHLVQERNHERRGEPFHLASQPPEGFMIKHMLCTEAHVHVLELCGEKFGECAPHGPVNFLLILVAITILRRIWQDLQPF